MLFSINGKHTVNLLCYKANSKYINMMSLQPDWQTDIRGYREVTLPIMIAVGGMERGEVDLVQRWWVGDREGGRVMCGANIVCLTTNTVYLPSIYCSYKFYEYRENPTKQKKISYQLCNFIKTSLFGADFHLKRKKANYTIIYLGIWPYNDCKYLSREDH